ncbi:MAG: uracil-DNA glycosylase family protein [Gemmatimonadota bacterium]
MSGWKPGCVPSADVRAIEEVRFRSIFRRIHAEHPNCLGDEWLSDSCRFETGTLSERPMVWSRRNGPWQRSDVLWIGAAPGNAGGKGTGRLGAHGTRIPFGGDIAGGNLDALLGSIGLDRNRTFISASLNHLPLKGGGEPTPAELNQPVGEYPTSLHIVRDTILAAGPRLLIALGNVGLRVIFAATRLADSNKLPSQKQLESLGLQRSQWIPWPAHWPPDQGFLTAWQVAWTAATLPAVLWLTHPSAQNMSPYAGRETVFHSRMRDARDALRTAAREVLGWTLPGQRLAPPSDGIYALPEWRDLIAPRNDELDRLWRAKGI